MIDFVKQPAAVATVPDVNPIEHVAVYLRGSGPTRFWAVSAYLADIGIKMSPGRIRLACTYFPESFLEDADHNGPLIGIRTPEWASEVGTRRSLDIRARTKEQKVNRPRPIHRGIGRV